MFSNAFLFLTVVLWLHHGIDSRKKFVLDIRNGTLFLQEKKATAPAKDSLEINSINETNGLSDIDSDNEKVPHSKVLDIRNGTLSLQEKKATVPGKDSLAVNSINETNGLSDLDSDNEKVPHSKEIVNNIVGKNNTTDSEWMEIERLLDSDAYSIANENKNFQLINSANINDVFYDGLSLEGNDNVENIMAGSRGDISSDNSNVSINSDQTLSSNVTINETISDLRKAVQKDYAQMYDSSITNEDYKMAQNVGCLNQLKMRKNELVRHGIKNDSKVISANVSLPNNTNEASSHNEQQGGPMHDLSIVEVQILPDDNMASGIQMMDRNLRRTVPNKTYIDNDETLAHGPDEIKTVNKSLMNQNHTQHKSSLPNKHEVVNETTVIHNGSKGSSVYKNEMPTNNSKTERGRINDTRVNGSTVSGLNIIDIQMLSGDIPTHNIAISKRHDPYIFGADYHQDLNDIRMSNPNNIHRKTMNKNATSIEKQKRFKISNKTSPTAAHHISNNTSLSSEMNKKHRIVYHGSTRDSNKHLTSLTKRWKIARNDAKSLVALRYHKNKDVKKKGCITTKSHHKRKRKRKSNKIKSKSKRTNHSKGTLNKRRLVSNHVPLHRENETKFKNLHEEDGRKKKKKTEKSGNGDKTTSSSSPDTTVITPSANTGNKTNVDTPVSSNSKSIDMKESAIDDGFSKRPTIAPKGINKNKMDVLQSDTDTAIKNKETEKQADTESEYRKDVKYPSLGVFRHPKNQENLQSTKKEKDIQEIKYDDDEAVARKTVTNDSLIYYNGTTSNNTGSTANVTLKRILCFGDSLTKGMYAKGEIYHPYTLKLRELFGENKRVNYHITNHGMKGECVSRTMKTRLADDLNNLPKLDLVVILGGTNDLLQEDCARKIDLFEEIKNLHSLVHNKGYKSVVVTIPESHVLSKGTDKMSFSEYNNAIEDVNQKLRVYAASEKIPLCDLADEFPRHTLPGRTHMASMWDDRIHPSAKGYDRIGEIIYDDIKGYV